MSVSVRSAPVRFTAALVASLSLAACGHNEDQPVTSSDSGVASAASAGATPVGSMKPQMDSGLAAGSKRLDSLNAAGVSTKNGLDSVGSRVQATTANEPGHDTSRINNRATPGAGPAAPGGRSSGSGNTTGRP